MKPEMKWILPNQGGEKDRIIQELQKDPRLSRYSKATLNILVNRGMDTYEKIRMIFDEDIMNQHDPRLMKDSDKLIAHLKKAIQEDKHIVVYGDYDCDGASATAIAVNCLRHLGGKVDYFINNRFKHGYGISPDGVKDLIERYPTVEVILTVDNGVVAFDGVQAAMDRGIQVLVTDHHEPKPDGSLPPADAVVNPKRLDDEYPFKGICGAAVIYKMMMYLYLEMGENLDYVYSMVDIVGMATVGDVMPLVDENRLFVKESIKLVNKNPRYAFQALKRAIGQETIDEGTYGFQFVPMINSPGRLIGEIDAAVELFLAKDKETVEKNVEYLVRMNEKRKGMTAEQEKLADSIIEQRGVEPVIVLAHESFHEGIVGLVAGRIKEKYHRPAIVLTKTEHGFWKGSGRSIEGFSLIQSLNKMAPILHHYGGHDAACGVAVEDRYLDDFRQAMIDEANSVLTSEDFIPKLQLDVYLHPSEITEQLVEELDQMKPYGTAFESPNIAVKGFEIKNVFRMGKEQQHIKLHNDYLSLIMWNGAEFYDEELNGVPYVQAVGSPSLNYWNGKTTVQMMVRDGQLRAYALT